MERRKGEKSSKIKTISQQEPLEIFSTKGWLEVIKERVRILKAVNKFARVGGPGRSGYIEGMRYGGEFKVAGLFGEKTPIRYATLKVMNYKSGIGVPTINLVANTFNNENKPGLLISATGEIGPSKGGNIVMKAPVNLMASTIEQVEENILNYIESYIYSALAGVGIKEFNDSPEIFLSFMEEE